VSGLTLKTADKLGKATYTTLASIGPIKTGIIIADKILHFEDATSFKDPDPFSVILLDTQRCRQSYRLKNYKPAFVTITCFPVKCANPALGVISPGRYTWKDGELIRYLV